MISLTLSSLFVLYSAAGGSNLTATADKCPVWQYRVNGSCTCYDSLKNIVHCKGKSVYIQDCYCMTLDLHENAPVVGQCLYSCYIWLNKSSSRLLKYKIEPKNISNLSHVMCSPYNRQGLLCSKCKESYGLSVNAYTASCVPCHKHSHNWMKYIGTIYLPLTVFVFAVILFRFNANSGSMVAYITLSQILANRSVVRLYLTVFTGIQYKVLLTFYTMWNLGFLRPLISDICVDPNLTSLHVLALDYFVALYPHIIIFLTYLVVSCHDRSQLAVYLYRPLYTCLHCFRKEWEIGNSLIEAFATLFLLSFSEILSISCDILTYTKYHYTNQTQGHPVVYIDPSIPYFSKQHIPYFVLAVSMILVFNICPILVLFFHTCDCFQRRLPQSLKRWITTYLDAYGGSYKIKPKWFRSFTSIYLLANLTNILIFHTTSLLQYHTGVVYILAILLLLVTLLAPYKSKWHNIVNTILISSAMLANYGAVTYFQKELIMGERAKLKLNISTVAISLGFLALPFYGLCLLCHYMVPVRLKNYLAKRLLAWINRFGVPSPLNSHHNDSLLDVM